MFREVVCIWRGAAAVCVNADGQVLMVLQGQPNEEKRWTVPSGQQELHESLEACCVREVAEETGYRVRVLPKIWEKHGYTYGREVEVHYFQIVITGGTGEAQDPDGLIYAVEWKTVDELRTLNLSFPEDREPLIAWAAAGPPEDAVMHYRS